MKMLTALIFGLTVLSINSFALDTATQPINGEIKEVVLTQEEMKKYASVYRDPYVRHVRKAINNCHKKKYEGDDDCEAIKAIDQEYLKNKFIVLSCNQSLMGGRSISLISQKKPDKIFKVWVYRGDDDYQLRTINVEVLTDEQIRKIKIAYARFLQDKKLAL